MGAGPRLIGRGESHVTDDASAENEDFGGSGEPHWDGPSLTIMG